MKSLFFRRNAFYIFPLHGALHNRAMWFDAATGMSLLLESRFLPKRMAHRLHHAGLASCQVTLLPGLNMSASTSVGAFRHSLSVSTACHPDYQQPGIREHSARLQPLLFCDLCSCAHNSNLSFSASVVPGILVPAACAVILTCAEPAPAGPAAAKTLAVARYAPTAG